MCINYANKRYSSEEESLKMIKNKVHFLFSHQIEQFSEKKKLHEKKMIEDANDEGFGVAKERVREREWKRGREKKN